MNNKERQSRYNAKNKRIEIVFNSDKITDAELLDWLETLQSKTKSKSYAQTIKEILKEYKDYMATRGR